MRLHWTAAVIAPVAALVMVTLAACSRSDTSDAGLPAIGMKVAGMSSLDGFTPLWWDEAQGRLWLQPPALDSDILYVNSMARGVGSNDLGLDRGQLGSTRIVQFRRIGPRLLLVEPNLRYRADTDSEAERNALASSFAESVIWGFDIAAENDGQVLVDATDFFLRDSHGFSESLRVAEEGQYAIDESRSAVFLPRTKGFPDNTEVEALVTFVGTPEGPHLPTVVPDPGSVSVHFHHSFVRLPGEGFEPVAFDPRSGFFYGGYGVEYLDYASAIEEPMERRLLVRHRLKKKDPAATQSEAVEPIVYFVDPGAPEPVRSALIEGASWWNQAFEAAGYNNAFRVEVLPENADPMDVRYNVIQWVHRSTRGWSYGGSVVDPRTGEILKGHVTLGSLRVRQDYLIAQGLLSPFGDDAEAADEVLKSMALARIRQLSAHEVGHTLGLAHNFAASISSRASVMDYPHPLIGLDANGDIDLSDAYDNGIGTWDQRTILYGYQDFPGDVDANLARRDILLETLASGLRYLADEDARVPGAADPGANLWDNGVDAIDELDKLIEIRRLALSRFSESSVREGTPLARIEEVLVPIYLLHRYQVEATAKFVGGQWYTYKLKGDGQPLPNTVPAADQRRAIDRILATLTPEFLALPTSLIDIIPPRPPGHPLNRETFPRHTGVTFDPLGAAAGSVEISLTALLEPSRLARLEQFRARDSEQPGFAELSGRLLDASWHADRQTGYQGALHRLVNDQVLEALLRLAADINAAPPVRAQAYRSLQAIKTQAGSAVANSAADDPYASDAAMAILRIEQFERNGVLPEPLPSTVPPGSPIGSDGYQEAWR